MSDATAKDAEQSQRHHADTAPGDEFGQEDFGAGLRGYAIGLGLATLLTVASFAVLRTQLVWAPAIPLALIVFAIAQMGVHLVFFLHITTGPDNTNNVMALAFGVLIVVLVVGGSVWIMANMNRNMAPMGPTAPAGAMGSTGSMGSMGGMEPGTQQNR